MDKRIIVTGANGFIGRQLIEVLAGSSFQVTALIHHAYKAALPKVDYRQFDLDSFGSDIIPEGTKALVHAAYIPYKKGNNSDRRNETATRKLVEIAREKGVKKLVFLSSFAAAPNALSHYGRNKYRLEQLFDPQRDLVIRPGLVVGPGGLYRSLQQLIHKSKVIPLIGGGQQPVQLIEVQLLCRLIEAGIRLNVSGVYNLAGEQVISMKQLYGRLADEQQLHPLFVPLPYILAAPMIRLFEKIAPDAGIGMENYYGLKQMKARPVADIKGVFGMRTEADTQLVDKHREHVEGDNI